jgi:hypothetical protein
LFRSWGNTISARHAAAAALLAATALTLTACGPDDGSGTGASSAAPSTAASVPATASGKPSAKPTGGGSAQPSDCPTLAPGHIAIHVDNVNGAMNHVEAYIAKADCDPGLPDGPQWTPTTQAVEYTFSQTAKTKIIYDDGGLKLVPWDTALRHVQACEHPDKPPKGEECMANFYDVVVNSDKQITELTQLYHV